MRLKTGSFDWLIALICAILGALILVAPRGFTEAGSALPQSHAGLWGVALAFAGAGLLGSATHVFMGSRRALVQLFAGCVLLGLGISFALLGNWTSLLLDSLLGLATMLSGFEWLTRKGDGHEPRDLFDLTVALVALLAGAAGLAAPGQLNLPAGSAARTELPWFGALFLLGGALLLFAQLRRTAPRPVYLAAHVVTGVAFILYVAAIAWPARAWVGVVWYGGSGVALLSLPWADTHLQREGAPSLRVRLMLALCVAATVPLIAAVSLYAHAEETSATSSILARQRAVAAALAAGLNQEFSSYTGTTAEIARHRAS